MSGEKNQTAIDSEGKQMMFLIRSAFWLVVLILLIPTDGAQQKKIYGMAQTAVTDARNFCVRNPETCASGQYAVKALVQKAQYGAHTIQALVLDNASGFGPGQSAGLGHTARAGQPGGVSQPAANASAPNSAMMPVPSAVPIEPTPWVQSDDQNTLSPRDLEAEWSAPNL